jgi:hypothetical protein
MTSRSEVAARIRALLAKTVDKGCTEQEAMAAAAKAKELMDKYQLDLSEAELEEEGFVRSTADRAERRRFNVQEWIAGAVAAYTDTKCWRTISEIGYRSKYRYVFFGLKSDVEFANWLLKALEAFTWQKADEYGIASGNSDYHSKRDFAMACANRISARLRAEAEARKTKNTARASTGKSLVVVKHQLIEHEFNKLGLRLRGGSSRSYSGYGVEGSSAAGRAAGDHATFGRPMNGGRGTVRIGG